MERWRERERERERDEGREKGERKEREINRQTDGQTDRQTDGKEKMTETMPVTEIFVRNTFQTYAAESADCPDACAHRSARFAAFPRCSASLKTAPATLPAYSAALPRLPALHSRRFHSQRQIARV